VGFLLVLFGLVHRATSKWAGSHPHSPRPHGTGTGSPKGQAHSFDSKTRISQRDDQGSTGPRPYRIPTHRQGTVPHLSISLKSDYPIPEVTNHAEKSGGNGADMLNSSQKGRNQRIDSIQIINSFRHLYAYAKSIQGRGYS